MPDPRFIPCTQDQPMLLPPDIGELVPEGSMARVVDMVVRSIDRPTLTSLYPGGGAPSGGGASGRRTRRRSESCA